ncbi:hypothetical protein EAE99_006066 [Botrytis elliptica]|nr:hypothetical protein EAE99_006066 [Botrytis elliptica]
MTPSSTSTSPSTHQNTHSTHSTPSLPTSKPKPLTSKFTEERMRDEPSWPPPRKYIIDTQPSARSNSETARTDTHVARATYEQPPRSASEPVEVSSWETRR